MAVLTFNGTQLARLFGASLALFGVACSEGQLPSAQSGTGGNQSGGSTPMSGSAGGFDSGAGGTPASQADQGGMLTAGAGAAGETAGTGGVAASCIPTDEQGNAGVVACVPGLIAFWDFNRTEDELWTSLHDPAATDRSFPIYLRRIGDAKAYRLNEWPYTDAASELIIEEDGPFESSVRFNRGYVFGAVPRAELDGTALDINGRTPFTFVAWVKFTGQRHLVAGIWDEGGWNAYGGERQFALFGGLFGSKGVIAHVSATGAASYPQSKVAGSQYARLKAIDGQAFDNAQWVSMAMSFDPTRKEVSAYLDGTLTPSTYADPVIQDVFNHKLAEPVNPAAFDWPIFSPHAFILKFNGYSLAATGVAEHWLHIESKQRRVTYGRTAPDADLVTQTFRVRLDLLREGASLLASPLEWDPDDNPVATWPQGVSVQAGDEVVATLLSSTGAAFAPVGNEVHRAIGAGAPLTFGRALGLGSEELSHGSELRLGGVAVFNRILSAAELKAISF